jgi:ribonuclease HII
MESPPKSPSDRERYEELLQRYPFILGADECGYGSWAGPLVVCAVAVPRDWRPPKDLNDSKKLRPRKREELFEFMANKVTFDYEMAQPQEIDRDGVIRALKRCFISCIDRVLDKHPEALVVIDGEVTLPGVDHLKFPKADGIVPAVMAASVIGKVIHDREMLQLGFEYPGYGFGIHQGYGTPQHKKALAEKGPCAIHRKSYLPLKKIKEAKELLELDEEGISID